MHARQQGPYKAFSAAGSDRPHWQGGLASCLEEGGAAEASRTAWLQQGSHWHQCHTHGSAYCCHVSQGQWICLVRRHSLHRFQVSTRLTRLETVDCYYTDSVRTQSQTACVINDVIVVIQPHFVSCTSNNLRVLTPAQCNAAAVMQGSLHQRALHQKQQSAQGPASKAAHGHPSSALPTAGHVSCPLQVMIASRSKTSPRQLLQISCQFCCRHGPNTATLIQPVREVGMRELAMLCHYQGLPVAAPLNPAAALSKPSINTLSEQFVARLQANVPSSVSTILRTACKLQVNPIYSHSLAYCPGHHAAGQQQADSLSQLGCFRFCFCM